MNIVIVAAIGENYVIGRDGQMPWRLRSDLKHFRALTVHKPVVMGRKTYEAIGQPLKDRTNIVVTRDLSLSVPGGVLALSLDAALSYAEQDAARRREDEIMIIGGGEIYAAMMPLADRLEITHVHAAPPGDAFFPVIDPSVWQEASRSDHQAGPDDSAPFSFVTYVRR